ncbi:alanyl-tRNA editing protein [Anaeramoeba flamelloides]|uniref:Alanyl-tRNA editing protein n=1 Tax=Anaeramoeba flamelloides TaxID=1746091 RepID=A0ABQ8XTB8_9EUKA|nr:alanyl-tRNA editing protein [Anaeramoeba flamelloides]
MTEQPVPYVDAKYLHDSTLKKLETKISSIEEYVPEIKPKTNNPDHKLAIILMDTIYHIKGGGQHCDVGFIRSKRENGPVFEVSLVVLTKANKVIHIGKYVDEESQFEENEEIEMEIDWEKRFMNMRLHTAGHILATMIDEVTEYKSKPFKGNHIKGQSAVVFKGNLIEDNKGFLRERNNIIAHLQETIDQIVNKNLQIKHKFITKEDFPKYKLILPYDLFKLDKVRIVWIDGYQPNSCGGTHIQNTSEIGRIKIKKITQKKGIVRISYDVTD